MENIQKQHWENIFDFKVETELSWFQPYPATSMNFIDMFQLPVSANIIDIGGGDSHFVDALLDRGYQNIWVLDISANAIDRAKRRLGEKALKVHWIVSDITDFMPSVKFDFWHDRAAFHFLTTEEKIGKYVSTAANAIKEKAFLILGTFSVNGPTKCSGLEVLRYSEVSMSARFDAVFDRIKCIEENHVTPFDTVQSFLFCSFIRK